MGFAWIAWSNPVAVWWSALVGVSVANVTMWLVLRRGFCRRASARALSSRYLELMLLLCGAYVFGCAFRSVLPRADVQRICLFDTWLSAVVVGRSVATIAEVCFVAQWAIVLRRLAEFGGSTTVHRIAGAVVPLILVAECCSWYAVVTTSYLGNAVENSIWAGTFLLVALALLQLMTAYRGIVRYGMGAAVMGVVGYLAFLVTIDVPMYLGRWESDISSGKELLGIFSGLHDASTRWVVTHDPLRWQDEMTWMALYFSVAVWSSLGLCSLELLREHLPRYHRAAGKGRVPDEALATG